MFALIFNSLVFVLLVEAVLVNAANYLKEQPAFIPPCRFSDSNYDECMTNQMQKVYIQLAEGIPGLKNFPRTDPYYVNKVKIDQGTGNVQLKVVLQNVVVTGLKNLKVEFATNNKKDYSWDGRFLVPKIKVEADYEMDGRILIVPLRGKGKFFVEIENPRPIIHCNTVLYDKGGFKFYNVTECQGDIRSVTGMKIRLDNLFGGNKELERSTNEFFNENWKDVYEAMKPVLRTTVEEIIFDIVKRFYHAIPANFFVQDIQE